MSIEEIIPSLQNPPPEVYGNTAYALANDFRPDLLELKEKLKNDYGLQLGKFLGCGAMSMVFEVENVPAVGEAPKPFKKSVIRLSCKDMEGLVDNPAVIQPIFTLSNPELGKKASFYSATIVPKIDEARKGRIPSDQELLQSLACLNTKGQLGRLCDVNEKQFSYLPGIDFPVLIDLSSVNHDDAKQQAQKSGLGGVDKFIKSLAARTQQAEYDIANSKMPLKQLIAAEAAQRQLSHDALQEFRDRGVKLETKAQILARQLLDAQIESFVELDEDRYISPKTYKSKLEFSLPVERKHAIASFKNSIKDPEIKKFYQRMQFGPGIAALLGEVERGKTMLGAADRMMLDAAYKMAKDDMMEYEITNITDVEIIKDMREARQGLAEFDLPVDTIGNYDGIDAEQLGYMQRKQIFNKFGELYNALGIAVPEKGHAKGA